MTSDKVEQRYALPWPPSTNELNITVMSRPRPRRVISPRYRAWRLEAGLALNAQHPAKVARPVTISVELNSPHKRPFDPDNRIKAVLDLLVAHGVIPDDRDRWVREAGAKVMDSDAAPCVVVVREA